MYYVIQVSKNWVTYMTTVDSIVKMSFKFLQVQLFLYYVDIRMNEFHNSYM
jgi:hypothetical protein